MKNRKQNTTKKTQPARHIYNNTTLCTYEQTHKHLFRKQTQKTHTHTHTHTPTRIGGLYDTRGGPRQIK